MDPLTERRFLPNYNLEALNIHFGVFLWGELQKVIEQVFTRCHSNLSIGYPPISEIMQEIVDNAYVRWQCCVWRAILQMHS